MIPRMILITVMTLPLAACLITGSDGKGTITIKPTAQELSSVAKRVICESFSPITYSGKGDTPATVKQVREHNAALRAYGCK